ncbi:hypothetical protein [Anaerolinea thermophila]|uniref:hypothetical protein n=1 Tax=Anaerolinea thermophila TaxID=167964 RepID=UPI0026F31CBB|nr:hypothetical protein [Anaerolinea thermophila]
MKNLPAWMIVLLILATLSACLPTQTASPTPNVDATIAAGVATRLAELQPTQDIPATVSAQQTQFAQFQPTQAPTQPPVTPTPALSDEEALRQALLAYLGWQENELIFSLGKIENGMARGGVKRAGEESGAGWFAGKQPDGTWVIVHVGQGVPYCADIAPFPFPTDWISHCVDASGNTVQR